MNSQQRILRAIKREETDHLPCSIYFNSNLRVPGYDLTDWKEHVRLQLDLDLDPVVDIRIPNRPHPEVTTKTWTEKNNGTGGPILYKEYETPAGTLRMGVQRTPDWPSGEDIPWGDHSASNLREPLIKSPDDVGAFEYIWRPPDDEDVGRSRDGIEAALDFARDREIAVRGYAGSGLATLMFVMGAENMVMFAVDHPDAFQRLALIDSRTNVARIRLSAEAGADFVKRFGGYEQANFLNPDIFRKVVLPLLKAEVRAARTAGILIYYRVVTGMAPVLEDIASVGFDCIEGGEPRLSNCSLERWCDAFAGQAASWTGISTPALLGSDDPEAVRREVRHCIEVFGRRGFILGVTNSIRNHFPWANTLAMIDEWKRIR